MHKFKKGDRVILLPSAVKSSNVHISNVGKVVIVTEVSLIDIRYNAIEHGNFWAKGYDVELESVYNSPLYRALL